MRTPGITMSATTDPVGQYTFSPIKIGRYFISASRPGFKTVQQKNVTVDVQQKVEVNIEGPRSSDQKRFVVNAAPPMLQTMDASVGQVVEEQTIDNLPLNGRNLPSSHSFPPGFTQGQQDSRGLGSSGSFAANGLRPAQNTLSARCIDTHANPGGLPQRLGVFGEAARGCD